MRCGGTDEMREKRNLVWAPPSSTNPNLIAKSQSAIRTKLIGLVANNFKNPMFLEV
jgi:hypothetical protein